MIDTKNKQKIFLLKELGDIPFNATSRYLLPSLCLNVSKINILKPNLSGIEVLKYYGFKNSYLNDVNKKLNPYSLIMLFNPKKEVLREWHRFFSVCSEFYNFLSFYSIDAGIILLEFRIDEKYKNFKDYLIEGKFSKMNVNNYITFFTKNISQITRMTEEGLIISKSESYRKVLEDRLQVKIDPSWELGSKPNIEEEVLNLNYKNLNI